TVSGDRFAFINDPVEKLNHVPARNFSEIAPAPTGKHMFIEIALRLFNVPWSAAFPGHIACHELADYALDGVRFRSGVSLSRLGGIPPLAHRFVKVGGGVARRLHCERPMKADRYAALPSALGSVLKDVHPFAGWVDPNPEPRNLAVPDEKITPRFGRWRPFDDLLYQRPLCRHVLAL